MEFLQEADKVHKNLLATSYNVLLHKKLLLIMFMQDLSILRQRYGGAAFPIPSLDTIQALVINELLEISTTSATDLAIVANPELTVVPRGDVGQGDLAKVSYNVH